MATIITIAATDNVGESRVDLNTNFANLNADKLEAADITGKANLSGATFTGNVSVGANILTAADLRANSSAGGKLTTNGGTEALHWGSGGGANGTLYGGWNYDNATANTIAGFGGSKTLTSLDTSTYPSLTELAYVKGVTSGIQTQLNDKVNSSALGSMAAEDAADYTPTSGLAAVATSNDYDDLDNRPTLGTAAARNIHVGATPPDDPQEGDIWLQIPP